MDAEPMSTPSFTSMLVNCASHREAQVYEFGIEALQLYWQLIPTLTMLIVLMLVSLLLQVFWGP